MTVPFWGHSGPVNAVAYSPDGACLATAADDATTRVWDSRSGAQQRTLTGHTGGVNGVAYHPDGAFLATAGRDGTVRVWDSRSFEQ